MSTGVPPVIFLEVTPGKSFILDSYLWVYLVHKTLYFPNTYLAAKLLLTFPPTRLRPYGDQDYAAAANKVLEKAISLCYHYVMRTVYILLLSGKNNNTHRAYTTWWVLAKSYCSTKYHIKYTAFNIS